MFLVDKKHRAHKKVADKHVLIPWYPISYLTIAGYGFFWGRLRVPTQCCDFKQGGHMGVDNWPWPGGHSTWSSPTLFMVSY